MIQPIKYKILVMRDQPKEETEAGLLIPKEALKKEITGVVLATGPEADKDIEIGQKVVFGLHDGVAIDAKYCAGMENCWLIADNQVRAILG